MGVILIMLLFSFFSIELLIFCILFQIESVIEIIRQKQKKKVKNGNYSLVKLIAVRKILGNEDDIRNYEGTIEFDIPIEKYTFQLKHKFSSLKRPDLGIPYKIWVDGNEPCNSVVLNDFGSYWRYFYSIYYCTKYRVICS